MMPYGWHEGNWGILWMVASWVVIVLLVWVIARAIRPEAGGADRRRDPKEILQERFARGKSPRQSTARVSTCSRAITT